MKTNPMKSLRRRDAKSAQRVFIGERPALFRSQCVLVPVDFSACSRRALEYAVQLAKKFGASLTLLHVVPADYGWLGIEREGSRQLDEALQLQSADRLKALARAAIRQQVPADLEVRLGRPADEIVASATESKCDLILLSTHGHTGLDHYLLGSVAERVVRLAPCPVLVVRGGNPSRGQKQVRPAVLRFKTNGRSDERSSTSLPKAVRT